MEQSDKVVVRKLRKIAIISLIFMAVEIAGGILANSIAILADAFHLLSDVFAYSISLYAVLLSKRLAPKHMGFAYEKAQPLGALINVAIIWAVTIYLFVEATNRIIDKAIVDEPLYMLLTSFFGLGCNLFIMRTLHSDESVPCAHSHNHSHSHGHEHGNGKKTKKDARKYSTQTNRQSEMAEQQKPDHKHNHNHQSHDHESHGHHHHHHQEEEDQEYNEYLEYIEAICSCDSNENASTMSPENANESVNDSIKSMKQKLVEERQLESPLQGIVKSVKGYCALHPNESDESKSKKSTFENINMQAAYIHILSDIILSIGVIVSASIIYFVAGDAKEWSAWQLADPFCTYLFSIVALYSTISIVKEAVLILMDGCEDKALVNDTEMFINILRSEHGSKVEIDDARVWSSNRGKHYCTVKIRQKSQMLSQSTDTSNEQQPLNSSEQIVIVYRKLKAFMIQKKLNGYIDSRR